MPYIINIWRGPNQPVNFNYFYLRLYTPGEGFRVISEYELELEPNFEDLLTEFGGGTAGTILARILNRLAQ